MTQEGRVLGAGTAIGRCCPPCCRPNSLPGVGPFLLNRRDGGRGSVRKKEGPVVSRSLEMGVERGCQWAARE